jgi:hypothetical protein
VGVATPLKHSADTFEVLGPEVGRIKAVVAITSVGALVQTILQVDIVVPGVGEAVERLAGRRATV